MPGEAQPKVSRAHIEITTWVTKHVGGDGTGSKLFDEAIGRGDTPRTVLRRFTRRFPELDSALWSPDHSELGSHIEVLVNDAVLGVAYDLDTPLTGTRTRADAQPPATPSMTPLIVIGAVVAVLAIFLLYRVSGYRGAIGFKNRHASEISSLSLTGFSKVVEYRTLARAFVQLPGPTGHPGRGHDHLACRHRSDRAGGPGLVGRRTGGREGW